MSLDIYVYVFPSLFVSNQQFLERGGLWTKWPEKQPITKKKICFTELICLQMEAGPVLDHVRLLVLAGRAGGREAEALRRQQPQLPLAKIHRRSRIEKFII